MLDLPTPADRLSAAVARAGVAQSTLARELDCSPVRLNKWLRGHEPVPAYALDALAAAVGLPADEAAALAALAALHAQIREFGQRAERVPDGDLPVPAVRLGDALLRAAQDAAPPGGYWCEADRFADLRRAVSGAALVLRWLRAFFAAEAPVLSPQTVHLHLQFPFNLLLGGAITLPGAGGARDLADGLLASLRAAADGGGPDPDPDPATGEAAALSRQHALHMLARYGRPRDGDFVRDRIDGKGGDAARRMALYGFAAAAGDPSAATVERFVDAMDRDPAFARQTIGFDALHYGDTHLRRPAAAGLWPYGRAALALVRHLLAGDGIDVGPITRRKLVLMVETAPAAAARDPALAAGLRRLAGRQDTVLPAALRALAAPP